MVAVKLSTGENPRLNGYTSIFSSLSGKEIGKQCSYLTANIRELEKYAPPQKKFVPDLMFGKAYRGTDILNELDANPEISKFPEILPTERFDCYFVSIFKGRHPPLSSTKGLYRLSRYNYSSDSDIHNFSLRSESTGNEFLISCTSYLSDFSVFEYELYDALRPAINLRAPIKLSK
jgi:hypothetical protein